MIRSAAQYLFAMSDPAGRFRTLGVPRVVPPGNFRTGNDAVVFRVERDGKPEMLKCYLRPPQYMPERCRCSQLSPLTVSCRWLENEMLISDENGSPQWVDVTVGDWIEGESLHDLLFKAVIDRDTETLKTLSTLFDRFALRLLAEEWAHGDVKPDNMIFDGRDLRLVDIDSIFTPQLAGLTTAQLGTEGYRHPARDCNCFDCSIDDYPIAVMSVTLAALAADYDLYRMFDRGDGVLIDTAEAVAGCSRAVEAFARHFALTGDAAHMAILRMLRSPVPQLEGLDTALRLAAGDAFTYDSEFGTPQLTPCGGKWGFTNAAGEWVIPAVYDTAFEFEEGFAAVMLGGVWQYITPYGKPVLISPQAEAMKPVANGKARIRVNGQWVTTAL